MNDLTKLQKLVTAFRDERDWKQFHNTKDLAISLVLEASEVLEHFQWKSHEEMIAHTQDNKSEIADELSDVLYWVLLMANDLDIDISKSFQDKMKHNAKKYPINKSKGNHTKYTEL